MYALAFYKGRHRLLDRLIQWFTDSKYSHVELVAQDGETCISSSGLDGGVRIKRIRFDPEKWDIIEVGHWARSNAWDLAAEHLGAKYDFAGILFSQIFASRRQAKKSWFCSEIVGYALGLSAPHTLSPGELFLRVRELNRAFVGSPIAE